MGPLSLGGLPVLDATGTRSDLYVPLPSPAVPGSGDSAGNNRSVPDFLSSANLYGVKERSQAAEALQAVIDQVLGARGTLSALLQAIASGSAVPALQSVLEAPANELESLARVAEAAADLREHLFQSGARRMLHALLPQLPDRVASSPKYDSHEMGTDYSPWVDPVVQQLRQTTAELQAAGLDVGSTGMVLEAAIRLVESALVEGLSRVKRCSVEGRATMTMDLQVLLGSLRSTLGPLAQQRPALAEMRLAEAYIKAYYTPEDELAHWVLTHPQFTRGQLEALFNLMADGGKLRRQKARDILMQMDQGQSLI